MIGKSIGHLADAQMVVIKCLGVSLPRPAIVDNDVPPAPFLHGGLIDLAADVCSQVLPPGEPASGGRWLESAFLFNAGLLNGDCCGGWG